jgi:hypothetical protein
MPAAAQVSGAESKALAFTGAWLASYFLFYSGFDKATKKFKIVSNLKSIFSFKSVKYSLTEINKVAGLAGLTLLGAAALGRAVGSDQTKEIAKKVGVHAFGICVSHGVYSGFSHFDRFTGAKSLAMILGVLSVTGLVAQNTKLLHLPAPPKCICPQALALGTVAVATTHFYVMERKPDGSLPIRPWGYWAMVSGVAATFVLGFKFATGAKTPQCL